METIRKDAEYEKLAAAGQTALQGGEYVRAEAAYREALVLRPGDAAASKGYQEAQGRVMLAEGDRLVQANRLLEAHKAYQEAQKEPTLRDEAGRRLSAVAERMRNGTTPTPPRLRRRFAWPPRAQRLSASRRWWRSARTPRR
ncbi:MAG: hypothetical protein M5U26_09160 [Planctomycetota bacterium]|nr:hypothetical protein [Planctomycetota bacterium]